MDMMEQILHGIVFLLLFLQHVIRLLQMEKEMDMVQKMGIPVVLVIGTQNKFNFIQMMEQSLLIIQQQVNKQWGTYPSSGGTIRYPVSFTSKVFAVISTSSLKFDAKDIDNIYCIKA